MINHNIVGGEQQDHHKLKAQSTLGKYDDEVFDDQWTDDVFKCLGERPNCSIGCQTQRNVL